MTPIEALIDLLAESAVFLGMGEHSYIVGGAPRDFTLGYSIKDVDVVVEAKDGKDAVTLATEVAKRLGLTIHPDKYGVCHIGPVPEPQSKRDYFHMHRGVSLVGQKVEIVTARKEKYDRTRGKESHKPVSVEHGTIYEDLLRRDFTINTLVWYLADLIHGTGKAAVVDLLGMGLPDLKKGLLRTPLDPYQTFDDDPSRMLRAVRFVVKYSFLIEPGTYLAIQERAEQIRRLPYEAVDPIFEKILSNESSILLALKILDDTGLLKPVKDMIPAVRMRRLIIEHVKRFRTRLKLHWRGFDTGLKFVDTQNQRFQDVEVFMGDGELEALYSRFEHPVDVPKLIEQTGISGVTIGMALNKARNLVLLGHPEERVMQLLVEEYAQ